MVEKLSQKVTVISVPISAGNRDWGCKYYQKRFIIPFNESVKLSYTDIIDLNVFDMERSFFDKLSSGNKKNKK